MVNAAARSEGGFALEDGDLSGHEANEALVRALSMTCAGVINPMCAFLGGVVGQEVLKACSGKFTPIKQVELRTSYHTRVFVCVNLCFCVESSGSISMRPKLFHRPPLLASR
jgi:hypothetical protein